jgi:formiminotetrahydrofolate cyclodeaminase
MTSLEFACWGLFGATLIKMYVELFVHKGNYARFEKVIAEKDKKINEYENIFRLASKSNQETTKEN